MTAIEENSNQTLLFDKFKIISCLKKDSFSSVYLADHVYLNKKIVLKVLHTANLPDPSVLERFKREAKILARLDHPNIIRVLDFGPADNDFYLSFEFFNSQNLCQVLKDRKLDFGQKKNILIQLVQGLSAAHQAGIIHRDIKPENLLIDNRQQLKIADFGLALMTDETVLTKKSSLVGTPAYMSPEQIRGETLTPQSDLFSLGLVLYEMFCGTNPCIGHDINSTINTILTVDPQHLSGQMDSVDEQIKQIIVTCLQRAKNKRFKSADDILKILNIEKIGLLPRVKSGKYKRIIFALAIITAMLVILLLIVKVNVQQRKDTIPAEAISKSDTVIHGNMFGKEKSLKGELSTEPTAVKISATASHNKSSGERGNFIILGTPLTTVFVDSQEIGQIPLLSAVSLPAGVHNLVLKHKDYPLYAQKLEILAGKSHIMQVALDTLFGYLNCRIYPWGELYIDNLSIGQSPFLKPVVLAPGEHSLTIRNPLWTEFRDTITISRKETTDYYVNLEQWSSQMRTDSTKIH
jgi:serine/threonine protein kinase